MYFRQNVGVGLLIAAGILGLAKEFGYAWAALGVTGFITLLCALRDAYVESTKTVSQWIQDLTDNKVIDYIAGSTIIAVAIWQHFTMVIPPDSSRFEIGMMTAFWPLICGLAIHFFANKD